MYFKRQKYIGGLILTGCLWSFFPDSAPAQSRAGFESENQTLERKLSDASAAISTEDFPRAEKITREILLEAPANATAHILAGIIADRKNDLKAAEKHFARAAEIAPKLAEARNNYGAILLRLERTREAAAEFEASLKLNPEQVSALVNLGQIRLAENDFPQARDLFLKAENIKPDAEILRALVLISLRMNETARAAAEFKRYRARLKTDPSEQKPDAQTERLFAEELSKNDLIDEAKEVLEFSISQNPDNTRAIVSLSRIYLKQKNIKSAGRLLESAAARGGAAAAAADAEIYAALADVYKAGGYFENAIPAMRLAIEKDPDNEFYRARYGLLLIDSKAPAAAIIRLEEAVREFPGSARLYLALGIAQQSDGRREDARESFKRSLAIEPESVPALAYLATSLIENARYNEAVEIYKKALSLEKRSAVLHYLIADTLLKVQGAEPGEIQKHLLRSVELDAGLPQSRVALGKLYARAGQWEKAAAEFELAVRLSPETPEAHYQLGRTLSRLKRREEAKAAIEKYKQLSEKQTAQKELDRRELVRRLADVAF